MIDRLVITKSGGVRAIYSDRMAVYIEAMRAELGLRPEAVQITRASHVEPDPQRTCGNLWYVDLSPKGGGVHYRDEDGNPFMQHRAAIEFELRWLTTNWLMEDTNVGTQSEA